MPIAIVKLDEKANRIINIVKAKYGLKDKSSAINKLVWDYEEELLEPELKPEYVEKLHKIDKTKSILIKNADSYFESLKKR